jgi:hypothetical protein
VLFSLTFVFFHFSYLVLFFAKNYMCGQKEHTNLQIELRFIKNDAMKFIEIKIIFY